MTENDGLDLSTLESWLWDAACVIRGPVDAPKYKDYILPLIFLKRLSDVFEDELADLADVFGSAQAAEKQVEEDHGLVRFYIPAIARWPAIARQTTGLGEYLTDAVRAVARENPELKDVIDLVDFNARASGQPTVDNDRLVRLVDCMVALPDTLFYSTQILACLWFLARDKKNGRFGDRRGEVLFISAGKADRTG